MAWIVLASYFASAVVAARGAVICEEPDGRTVLEIAGGHGQCDPGPAPTDCACEHADDHVAECAQPCCDSCPCEDTPLAMDATEPGRKLRLLVVVTGHAAPPGASFTAEQASAGPTLHVLAAPPATRLQLRALRSVRLLV